MGSKPVDHNVGSKQFSTFLGKPLLQQGLSRGKGELEEMESVLSFLMLNLQPLQRDM
jgi:hypothetical protein